MSASVARAIVVILLGINADVVLISRRVFTTNLSCTREHLDEICRALIFGYKRALSTSRVEMLIATSYGAPRCFQGFAFEGVVIASYLLDLLTLSQARRPALHNAAGDRYQNIK